MLQPLTKLSFILLIIIATTPYASGQWQAVTFRNTITDTLYYLNTDTSIRHFTQLSFPEYYSYEKTTSKGFNFLNTEGVTTTGGNAVWSKKLANTFDLYKDTLALKYQLYTSQVKSFTVYVYSRLNNAWFSKPVYLKGDGFNEPAILFLSTLTKVTDSVELTLLNSNATTLQLNDSSCILISISNITAGAAFIMGDLVIGRFRQKEVNVSNPFFNTLLKTNNAANAHTAVYVSNTIHSSPDFFFNPTLNGYIVIKAENGPSKAIDEKQELKILKDILLLVFDKYPYFKEYAIDKASTTKEFIATWQKNEQLPYCEFIDTISRFIERRFKDGHFRLVNSTKCKTQTKKTSLTKSPVRIYTINDNIYISAVFDTLYKIQPGSLVTAIDGIPSQRLLDSLQKKLNRSSTANKTGNRDVSMLMERTANDSALIEYVQDGKATSTYIKYNRPVKVPPNFVPAHAEYKSYDNGKVSYFRINSWFNDVYPRFMNNRQSIAQSNTLIIDLRGNGGGELLSSIRLFSLFIDAPKVFSIAQELSTNIKGNVVIKPNAEAKLFRNKQVIILGDAATACASESFISAMKQLPNVIYISADDRTTGMIASRYDIHFPSGIYLTTDAVSEKIFMYDGKVIENIGIKPDIKVSISNIADLRPYDDKVLQTALTTAKHFKNN